MLYLKSGYILVVTACLPHKSQFCAQAVCTYAHVSARFFHQVSMRTRCDRCFLITNELRQSTCTRAYILRSSGTLVARANQIFNVPLHIIIFSCLIAELRNLSKARKKPKVSWKNLLNLFKPFAYAFTI